MNEKQKKKMKKIENGNIVLRLPTGNIYGKFVESLKFLNDLKWFHSSSSSSNSKIKSKIKQDEQRKKFAHENMV